MTENARQKLETRIARQQFCEAIASDNLDDIAAASYNLTHAQGGETALLGLPLDVPTIQPVKQ